LDCKAALSVALAAAACVTAGPVLAQSPPPFAIRPQPLSSALVEFASTAKVSISAEAARSCGPTRGLTGRFSTIPALRRLLSGTGCDFRTIDAVTFVIVKAAPARRPPARASTGPAAAPSPAGPSEVAELVVTSPKRTVGLARAPYAVSAVDGEALAERGEADLIGVSSRIAGMTITNLGPGRNKVFLRGMADGALSGRTQSVVGIYLDDARIIYNAPDPDLRLTDVERVEVLRGPQGSLYGAGSIGGVVQIVTKAPRLDAREGFLSTGFTATRGGAAGTVVDGAINLPLIEDRLALRLTGYREETGGVIDDPGLGLKDAGGVLRQGLRASLALKINDEWRARLSFIDQTIHGEDSQYAEGGAYSRALAMREPHRNDFDGVSTVVEGDLGFAKLKVSNALQSHQLSNRYDASLSLPLLSASARGPAAFDEDNRIQAVVTEASLSSPGSDRLSWLAGLFVSEYTQETRTALSAASAPVALYAQDRRDHLDEYAVYGEGAWSVNERLRLTAGGRYYRLAVDTRAAGASPFEGDSKDSGFAPKLLAEYDLSPALLLYAQMAEGYRAVGFNTSGLPGQVFATPGQGAQPNREFKADELISYELGVRATLFADRLRVRAALFRANWSNIQSDRLLPNGLPFTANIGSGNNTGVEFEASWRSGGLSLEGDVFLNDPELSEPDPGFPIPADRHLPGIASVLINGGARYAWTFGAGWQAEAGLDLGYIGKSSLTFDAQIAPVMGGYVTSRLHLALGREAWRLSLYGDNLFGGQGDTFAFGNPFRIRRVDEATPQRPRNVGVHLSHGF